MKKIVFILALALVSLTNTACNPNSTQNSDNDGNENSDKVEVYYFHFTRRCTTCNAVESITKEALNQYFSEKMKSGKITFQSINLEEETSKELASKLKINGQALLVVFNGKQVDLTAEAFMNALGSPEKLKEKIKTTIKEAL